MLGEFRKEASRALEVAAKKKKLRDDEEIRRQAILKKKREEELKQDEPSITEITDEEAAQLQKEISYTK